MRTLSDNEERHVKSLDELRTSSSIEIDFHEQGTWKPQLDANPIAVNILPQFENVTLGNDLRECNLRITELSCRWRTVESSPQLGGEFTITDLYDAILLSPPKFTADVAAQEDLQVYPDLRVVDFTQHAGTGQMAAIRIQPHVDPLEIWYYDMNLSRAPSHDSDLIKMDLTYCEYLDTLLLTKGTFGWQYLFTDISLSGNAFRHTVEQLKRMLELFPAVFPDHDYSSLAARLEARL
ncbi:hypothetical protein [Streptomyces platensis]|uniref:hypothetical protein n=1 Tax=Streptomyces platensis TaxID=58346 RepID=UPI002E272518